MDKEIGMRTLCSINYGDEVIDFGLAVTVKEKAAITALRFKVFKREGYYQPNTTTDSDEYDKNAVHFAARIRKSKLLVGGARLVKGEEKMPFPMERAFDLSWPEEITTAPRKFIAEIGKLVSDVPPETAKKFPGGRLVITTGLICAIMHYTTEKQIKYGVSFIKMRLFKVMKRYNFPLRELPIKRMLYPKNGILAPYFYQHADAIVPVFYEREEMGKATRKIVRALKIRNWFLKLQNLARL